MKKYSILLSAAFAIFALASCQKEQEVTNTEVIDNAPKSVPFVLRANIPSVDTKTTLNTSTWAVDWEDTDVIYAVTTDVAWGVAYNDDKSGETIAEFAYNSVNGTFSTDKAIADGSHTFNFLYTAGQQKSYHRGASTTFQLAGTQTFDANDPTANLKSYDALAAQVTATTPTTFADVQMSHLFSLMKVTLKNKTGADVTMSKFEIEIPGQNLYGIFNVTFDATPSVSYGSKGGNKITVNISNGTVANNGSLDVYFVMGPVTSYTGDVTFTVTDSEDNTYTKTNSITAPGVTFAAGTYNTANYTIKNVDPPTTTSWVETAIGSLAANDVVVIVDKTSSKAMTNGNGASNPPTASSVTISGSNITSAVADNMQWVIEIPSANNYSFKVPNTSNYLYTTNNNNGVRVGTNANKVFTLSTNWLQNVATSRYVGVYNGQDWRCYEGTSGNISGTVTAFYKKVSVVATAYSISITTPSNGTVTTSPASTAYEASTVTITATPDAGFALSALTVNAGAVVVTPVDATHYTFTMPSEDVTIAATFAQTYTITPSATNGSIEVSPSTTSIAGETITITATPDAGYAFSSWTVTGATPADASANPTTFTMPSGNVTVTANFVTAKTITRLIASIEDVSAAGVDSGVLDGAYSLTNASDSDLTVTSDGTVVTGAIADSGSIMYDVAANTGAARSGWIRIAVAGGNTIEIAVNQLAGVVDYSSTNTSNCTFSAGSGGTKSTLTIDDVAYDCCKLGTNSGAGSMTINVPANKTKITIHMAAYGTNTPSVSIVRSSGTISSASQAITGGGFSGNPPFSSYDAGTYGAVSTHSYTYTLSSVGSATTITLSVVKGSNNRAVVWGINAD